MVNVPEKLKYDIQQHIWVETLNDGDIYLGLTDDFQEKAGKIHFVELGEEGSEFEKGEVFTTVETEKKSYNLKMPFQGEVIVYNQVLDDEPESINDAPYDSWIVKVKIKNRAELENLSSASDYMNTLE